MNQSEIVEAVKSFFIRELLEGQEGGLEADTPLLEQGLINSMSIVSLTAFVEEKYSVKIEPRDLTPDNLATPAAIAALVLQYKNGS